MSERCSPRTDMQFSQKANSVLETGELKHPGEAWSSATNVYFKVVH